MAKTNPILPGEYDLISEVVASLYEYTVNSGTVVIGALQSVTPSGSRRVTESFEIGRVNSDTIGEPFELITAPPTDRRIEVRKIALFRKELLDVFGIADVRTLTKLKKKFDIKEWRYVKGAASYTRKNIKTYKDCYIIKYGATRDITGADVREIQTATIAYRYIAYIDYI